MNIYFIVLPDGILHVKERKVVQQWKGLGYPCVLFTEEKDPIFYLNLSDLDSKVTNLIFSDRTLDHYDHKYKVDIRKVYLKQIIRPY